ncbi:hypothetical protein LXL04_008005 [Taraxacum kok-saghyz]
MPIIKSKLPMVIGIRLTERTHDTSLVRDGLLGSQGKHPAGSRSCCLGAVPLEVTSVTTTITGPVGTCVVVRGWSPWCPLAVSGSVPRLLAACANKSSAGAAVVKVADGEVFPVLPLGCYGADGYSSIGSNGVLPLGWCVTPVIFPFVKVKLIVTDFIYI